MKNLLRKLFAFLLNPLENAEGDYAYSPSHRTILKVMGVLFLAIAAAGLYFVLQVGKMDGLFAVVLFTGIAFACLIVAYLGNDKAVAKLWRNRNES